MGKNKEGTKVVQDLMRHASSRMTLDALQRKGLDVRRHRKTVEEPLHRVILQYLSKGPAAGLRIIEQTLPHGCAHILYNIDGHRMASM